MQMGISSKTWSWSEELFAATTPVSPCDGARLHEYSSFLPAPDSFMLSDQREQLSNASSMASAPASVLLLPRRPTSNAGFVGIQPTRQISGEMQGMVQSAFDEMDAALSTSSDESRRVTSGDHDQRDPNSEDMSIDT